MRFEEILSRELHEVADGLSVPALPPLPQTSRGAMRRRQPLLVAATVLLILAGAIVGVVAYQGGGERTSPAPPVAPSPNEPAPSPSTPAPSAPEIATGTVQPREAEAPAVPYVFEQRLYVAGARLTGSWSSWAPVHAGDAWLAERDDETWWWGTDTEPHLVPGQVIGLARLSPDGTMLAASTTRDSGTVLLIDTMSGETLNTLPIDVEGDHDDNALRVDAVTDEAKVLLSSDTQRVMWPAAEGDETADLDSAAPYVRGNTPAGLIVQGREATHLAELSDSGTLNRLRPLPNAQVVVNPSGTWFAYGGSWGGESETIPEITAVSVNGDRELTLEPPDDRSLLAMTWESDDHLLAELHGDGTPTGLARCSIEEERCRVIDAP